MSSKVLLTIQSDIHSVDGGPGKAGCVGDSEPKGPVRNVAHLSLPDGQQKASGSTVQCTGVESVNDGEARHLPFSLLLQEVPVRFLRVVCHAFFTKVVIPIVTSRSVDAVHSFFLY